MAPNYGTANGGEQRGPAGLRDAVDEERAALLGKPSGDSTAFSRLRRHLTVNIDKKWGDMALLACYVITGLLDSSSVQVWGSFVSMQTGNTVYLGLGIVAPNDSTRWIRSGISIACFCLGSMAFSHYYRYFGGRRRWVIVSSFAIQLLFMIGAALIVSLGPKTGSSDSITVWVALPLALIAFQSGGQAYTSRVLQYGGLTSVVLTSIYCDLFSDQKIFAGLTENVERNRRAAAPVFLLMGAMIGGLWAHSSVGLAGSLWSAVGLKFLVMMAFLFWKAEKQE